MQFKLVNGEQHTEMHAWKPGAGLHMPSWHCAPSHPGEHVQL
jgi:hypothetical protein